MAPIPVFGGTSIALTGESSTVPSWHVELELVEAATLSSLDSMEEKRGQGTNGTAVLFGRDYCVDRLCAWEEFRRFFLHFLIARKFRSVIM